MKKLIFSIVAIIAFSFTTIANTIIEEKLINDRNEIEIQKSNINSAEKSCALSYLADFKRLEDLGVVFEVAGAIAFSNYKTCKGLD